VADAALRARGDGVPAPRGGHAPRGVRHPAGPRAGPGARRLAQQERLGGAAQPRHPPAGRGAWAPGHHPGPGRSRLAGAVDTVPRVAPFRRATCQWAPAMAGSHRPPRWWRGAAGAAVPPGEGGRGNGARVVAHRRAPLPGAAMAATVGPGTGWAGRGGDSGAGVVGLDTGKEGEMRSGKRVARLDDRLSGPPQRAQEGAVRIIRRAQVRDRPSASEREHKISVKICAVELEVVRRVYPTAMSPHTPGRHHCGRVSLSMPTSKQARHLRDAPGIHWATRRYRAYLP
jgi:hypothetical protein